MCRKRGFFCMRKISGLYTYGHRISRWRRHSQSDGVTASGTTTNSNDFINLLFIKKMKHIFQILVSTC